MHVILALSQSFVFLSWTNMTPTLLQDATWKAQSLEECSVPNSLKSKLPASVYAMTLKVPAKEYLLFINYHHKYSVEETPDSLQQRGTRNIYITKYIYYSFMLILGKCRPTESQKRSWTSIIPLLLLVQKE